MSKSTNTAKRYTTIAALALAASLAGAAYASSDNHMDAQTRTEPTAVAGFAENAAPPLAADEVLARLRKAGYSDFRKIERENGRYEVKSIDAQGYRVELYVDARTGEVVKAERDD